MDESRHPLPLRFRVFFERVIEPRLTLRGYKLDEKRELAARIVHSLVVARKRSACVADSRDTHKPGVAMRVAVWNAIRKAGLAKTAIGSELARRTTRYQATPRLMKLRKRWTLDDLVDMNLKRNSHEEAPTSHALVILRSEKVPATCESPPANKRSREIDFRPMCSELGMEWLESVEDAIEAFNRNNLAHSWMFRTVDAASDLEPCSPLNPCVRQIHYGGQFFLRGMRFHSWSNLSGQCLSRIERRTILIDGQRVAELDFSGSQLRLLYHWRNIDPDQADVYQPERIFPKAHRKFDKAERKVLREFVKRATLLCLNVGSRAKAHSSVGKHLSEHEQRSLLWDAMNCDGFDIKVLVQRIVQTHHQIADWFFTSSSGLMMTSESHVMFRIMKAFTEAGKPALTIHDAIVCKTADVKFAQRVMRKSYQHVHTTRFKPVIKREF